MKRPSTASLRSLALLLCTVGLLWSTKPALADDPRNWGPPGKPIRQGHHIEWQRAAVTDANGYTLAVWSDTRTGDRDVFAVLIEPDGDIAPNWPVHVVNYPYRQEDPEPIVATDGFVVAWIDFRYDSTGDVFAQKLNYSGQRLWPANDTTGVVVDTFVRPQDSMVNETTLRGASDGSGGAIVAWEDNRNGDIADIYSQRIGSNGQRQWANALPVTNSPGVQSGITADTDGQGNLIVGWNDNRDGGNVFSAKITNSGTLPWGGEGGRVVCDAAAQQAGLKLCPDYTTGGAYFAWADQRDGTDNNLYMQHFDASGNRTWATDGVALCNADNRQEGVRITPSINAGSQEGVLLCWQDLRVNNAVPEVYAQKTNISGVHQWAANGVKVCGDAGPGGAGACRDNSRLTSDLHGGGLYVWDDTRHDVCNILQYNTYSNHLNASGTPMCSDSGVAINTNPNQQQDALLRTTGDGSTYFCFYSDFYRGSRTMRVAQINSSNCTVTRDQEYLFGLDGDATEPTNIRMWNGHVAFVWEDNRGVNFGKQIYYQVLDTTWERTYSHIPENGTPIAPVSSSGTRFDQSSPWVCSDGNNGFYCSFENLVEGVKQVRLQQVGGDGLLHCDQAGEIVALSGVDQIDAQVVPDGQGGCYVVWSGYDQSFQLDVWAMRVGPNCEQMWGEPTVLSEDLDHDDALQSVVADGSGCMVAVYQGGVLDDFNLYAAKVCGDGSVAWHHPVCTSPRDQTDGQVAADGQGGTYFVWTDGRDETRVTDIYGQRLNAAGENQWTNNGRVIVTQDELQKIPRMAVDSEGKVFVVWQDYRSGEQLDLYGMKLNEDGSHIWPEQTGRPICQGSSDQSDQQLLVEWDDGLYMVWEDGRTNPFTDIYGVHLDQGSNFTDEWWGTSGEPLHLGGVVNGEYQNQNQPALAHDFHGGTVAVWVDWRSSGKEPLQNIWGNWVNDYTVSVNEIPAPLPVEYSLSQNYPNPFNPTTEFKFTIPATEAVKINVYNTLGQQVKSLVDEVMHAGTYVVRYDASEIASGVYFYRLETPSFQTVRKMQLIK